MKSKDIREDTSDVLQRRIFIRNRLKRNGRISEDEIFKWMAEEMNGDYSVKKIRTDIAFISTYEGKNIFESRDQVHKKLEWVDDSRKYSTNRVERMERARNEKLAIARYASSLLTGFQRFRCDKDEKPLEFLASLRSQLNKFSDIAPNDPTNKLCYPHVKSTKQKLLALWREDQRRLFLDSGTTSQIFSDLIKNFKLPLIGIKSESSSDGMDMPSDERSLNRIEVVTNDRYIFHQLGENDVDAKVIIVGGRQLYKSNTIAGLMAEKFLKYNDITAHIAFVGVTSISLDQDGELSYLGVENEQIAAIKLDFLRRSDLRVVLADSSKFQFDGGHADYKMCPIKKNEIDMVITDKADPEVMSLFQEIGVPLIVCNDAGI
jgi:DeoR C terminal sensor domain